MYWTGLAPLRNKLAGRLRSSSTFHDHEYARRRFGGGERGEALVDEALLVLP